METPRNPTELPPPPGVILSLKAGFDAIASHLAPILLPLGLDALLWLGPRLSLQQIFLAVFQDMLRVTGGTGFSAEELLATQEFTTFLQRYNLLSLLRTFPIGITSLMTGELPVDSPLGLRQVVEVVSVEQVLVLVFGLTLLGWLGGGVYFRWVAAAAGYSATGRGSAATVFQSLMFSLLCVAALFLLGIPLAGVLSILYLIGPSLAQMALLALVFLGLWLAAPLFFLPHGIFVRGQNVLGSVLASLKMARFTLPTSSLFVAAVFLISQGLNFLWAIPPDSSWMTAVGLAGHAFITTALLAASFIYYRDMNVWLQTVLERLNAGTAPRQA
ncbi:MAG: hypothetical protein AB1564_02345 [Chloroflexota bacterium]